MGVLRAEQLPFFDLIDVLHNRKSCQCLTFCVMDAGGPVILLRDRKLVSFCNLVSVGFGVSLVDRG